MIQFELNDDGIVVNLSRGAGDLRAIIDYTKLPTLKTLPPAEREQFGAIVGLVIAKLEADLAIQANAIAMERLKKLLPLVQAPPPKALILPNG